MALNTTQLPRKMSSNRRLMKGGTDLALYLAYFSSGAMMKERRLPQAIIKTRVLAGVMETRRSIARLVKGKKNLKVEKSVADGFRKTELQKPSCEEKFNIKRKRREKL